MTTDTESLWDAKRTAKFLGKHTNWVYRHAKSGDLPCFVVGRDIRIDPQELERWLMSTRKKGK